MITCTATAAPRRAIAAPRLAARGTRRHTPLSCHVRRCRHRRRRRVAAAPHQSTKLANLTYKHFQYEF